MTDMQQLDRDSGEASEAKLNRLRELAEQATPGPWSWEYGVSQRTAWGLISVNGYVLKFSGPQDIGIVPDPESDMDFIEAANPSVILALLSERQANQDRIAELLTLMDEHDEKARHGMCGDIGPKARSLLSEAQPSLSSSGGDKE